MRNKILIAKKEKQQELKMALTELEKAFQKCFNHFWIDLVVFEGKTARISVRNLTELENWLQQRKEPDHIVCLKEQFQETWKTPWHLFEMNKRLKELKEREEQISTKKIDAWKEFYPDDWEEQLVNYIIQLEQELGDTKERLEEVLLDDENDEDVDY